MSALHEKLERLKQKQAEVERQLAAQAAIENAAVAKAFSLIVSSSSGAYRSAQTSSALDSLSTRERSTFNDWLNRIEQPASTTSGGSTATNQFASTDSQTGI